jgi:hypothetical protein
MMHVKVLEGRSENIWPEFNPENEHGVLTIEAGVQREGK